MAEKVPTTGRKRKTVFEKANAKRKADEDRGKSRVAIGAAAFVRWRRLKEQQGLRYGMPRWPYFYWIGKITLCLYNV